MACGDLEKGDGGGGGGGRFDSPVPGGIQDLCSVVCDSGELLIYYFLLMFYLVGFSKTWWHAALGIAVAATLYLRPLFVLHVTTQQGYNDVRPCSRSFNKYDLRPPSGDEPRQFCGRKILMLYYLFYTFYLVGFAENWWRALLGIVLTTDFVLLSFAVPCNFQEVGKTGRNYNDIKSLENDGGRELLSAVPATQNPGVAKKTQPKEGHIYSGLDRVSALILVLYYFFFTFYLVGVSKNLLHAALGIAVSTAFLLLSFCKTGLL